MSLDKTPKLVFVNSFAWIIVAFLLAPLFVVIPFSFTSERYLSMPNGQWSLRHYEAVFNDPAWLHAIGQSTMIGLCAMIIATVVGASAAIASWQLKAMPGKVISILALMPLVVPSVVTAMALSRSWVTLNLFDTFLGVILAHSIIGMPFVFLTVNAALSNLDERIVQAARSLGASSIKALIHVVVPNLKVSLFSGAAFAFFTSWDEVVVTLFVSSSNVYTLPRKIFTDIRENIDPAVTAIASMMILVTIFFAFYTLIKSRAKTSSEVVL